MAESSWNPWTGTIFTISLFNRPANSGKDLNMTKSFDKNMNLAVPATTETNYKANESLSNISASSEKVSNMAKTFEKSMNLEVPAVTDIIHKSSYRLSNFPTSSEEISNIPKTFDKGMSLAVPASTNIIHKPSESLPNLSTSSEVCKKVNTFEKSVNLAVPAATDVINKCSDSLSNLPASSEEVSNMPNSFDNSMDLADPAAKGSIEQSTDSPIQTPYFVCKVEKLIDLKNALGLIGSVLFSAQSSDRSVQMSGFLTLLSFTNTELFTSSNLEIFRENGYDPKLIHVRTMHDLSNRIKFSHPETNFAFKRLLRVHDANSSEGACVEIDTVLHRKLKQISSLDYEFEYTIANCGIHYFFALKENKRGFKRNVLAKWKHFATKLEIEEEFPIYMYYPSEDAFKHFREEMDSMFSIRRLFFNVIRETTHKCIRGWSGMCSVLLHLLENDEISQFRMISKCIFVDNYFLIKHAILKPEVDDFINALDYLRTMDIKLTDHAHLKFLYDKDVISLIADGRFPRLWYITYRIHRRNHLNETFEVERIEKKARMQLDRLIKCTLNTSVSFDSKDQEIQRLFEETRTILAPYNNILKVLSTECT